MVKIPYVIDNEQHRLSDVLNALLLEYRQKSLDIATAYFNLGGFGLLREGLEMLDTFRLILGDEPLDIPMEKLPPSSKDRVAAELKVAAEEKATRSVAKHLRSFLLKDSVEVRSFDEGFLHAKCYILYGHSPGKGTKSLEPVTAIVGSSNLTRAGLTWNKELNLSQKAVFSEEEIPKESSKHPQEVEISRKSMVRVGTQAISELHEWFERQWERSRDIKQELIDALVGSKFVR